MSNIDAPESAFANVCAACGDKTEVLNTRTGNAQNEWKPEGVRRRRQCLACGERFTTTEMRLTEYIRLASWQKPPDPPDGHAAPWAS